MNPKDVLAAAKQARGDWAEWVELHKALGKLIEEGQNPDAVPALPEVFTQKHIGQAFELPSGGVIRVVSDGNLRGVCHSCYWWDKICSGVRLVGRCSDEHIHFEEERDA